MGVAFLLLETKSVVQFALLFGTTWFVNALVFAGVLLSVLAAIEVARRVRVRRPSCSTRALLVALAVAWIVPRDACSQLDVGAALRGRGARAGSRRSSSPTWSSRIGSATSRSPTSRSAPTCWARWWAGCSSTSRWSPATRRCSSWSPSCMAWRSSRAGGTSAADGACVARSPRAQRTRAPSSTWRSSRMSSHQPASWAMPRTSGRMATGAAPPPRTSPPGFSQPSSAAPIAEYASRISWSYMSFRPSTKRGHPPRAARGSRSRPSRTRSGPWCRRRTRRLLRRRVGIGHQPSPDRLSGTVPEIEDEAAADDDHERDDDLHHQSSAAACSVASGVVRSWRRGGIEPVIETSVRAGMRQDRGDRCVPKRDHPMAMPTQDSITSHPGVRRPPFSPTRTMSARNASARDRGMRATATPGCSRVPSHRRRRT